MPAALQHESGLEQEGVPLWQHRNLHNHRERRKVGAHAATISNLEHVAQGLALQLQRLQLENDALKMRLELLTQLCSVNQRAIQVLTQVSYIMEGVPSARASGLRAVQCIETCVGSIMSLLGTSVPAAQPEDEAEPTSTRLHLTSLDTPVAAQLMGGGSLSVFEWALHMLHKNTEDFVFIMDMDLESVTAWFHAFYGKPGSWVQPLPCCILLHLVLRLALPLSFKRCPHVPCLWWWCHRTHVTMPQAPGQRCLGCTNLFVNGAWSPPHVLLGMMATN
jgi:hypothetical protein